jgi:SAM-dependent methyltransferase
VGCGSASTQRQRRFWQRGDLSIENRGGRVWLRHRLLPPATASTVVLRTSQLLAIIEYLAEPRTDDALIDRFPGTDLVGAVRTLAQRGLIFRSREAEKSYLLRHLAIHVLRTGEAMAQDVLGFGPMLFDDERRSLGEAVAADLERASRLLTKVQQALGAERARYIAQQCDGLAVLDHFGSLQLNLGSGRRQLTGWIGIDVLQSDLRLNLRWGLPFPDGAAHYVYSAHLLEHLYYEDAQALLGEIYRVLRPDGILRLVVPDIAAWIAAYSRDDRPFFDGFTGLWPALGNYGTPLARLLAYAGAGALPGDLGAHKFGYDFETLAALLRRAGFDSVERSTFNGGRHPALRIDDLSAAASLAAGETHYSLFVEASRRTLSPEKPGFRHP